MHERRAVERHLFAVRRVAVFVANALVHVEDRDTLRADPARFGHARVRAIGHVRSGQRTVDYSQRPFVDRDLKTTTKPGPRVRRNDLVIYAEGV